MQQVVFLLVAAVLGVVIFKLRGDAAKERKAVMARLAAEREVRGDYSPTAELFREVGVSHDPDGPLPRTPKFERLSDAAIDAPAPVAADTDLIDEPAPVGEPALPDEPAPLAEPALLADAAPTLEPHAPAEAPASEPSDLRTLFKGISMPAGLKPLGPLVPVSANFVTAAAPAEVHAGLDAEFERLHCAARWVEPTVAQTERNGMRGLVTIYPNPVAAIDLDGNPLFPGVEPGQVVVRMLAL